MVAPFEMQRRVLPVEASIRFSAGILELSVEPRNRVDIALGLSYRTDRLHRLAE